MFTSKKSVISVILPVCVFQKLSFTQSGVKNNKEGGKSAVSPATVLQLYSHFYIN